MPPGDTIESTDVDRPVGFLNRRMREYLVGHPDSDITIGEKTQQERDLRSTIRSRTLNTLMDFELLQNLREDDRKQIYGDLRGWLPALVFLFRPQVGGLLQYPTDNEVVTEHAPPGQLTSSTHIEGFFEGQLATGIRQALRLEGARGFNVHVDVTIEPMKGEPIDRAIDKLIRGVGFGDLEQEELRHYALWAEQADSFEPEDVARDRQQYFADIAEQVDDSLPIDESKREHHEGAVDFAADRRAARQETENDDSGEE